MQIIYTGQPLPISFTKSIFLAGPSPRSKSEPSWRPQFVELLKEEGYDGVVFYPEYPPDAPYNDTVDYEDVAQWEKEAQNFSDVIVFWVDRDLETKRYGLTTNLEYGEWVASGKTILGWSAVCDKYRALEQRAKMHDAIVLESDMWGVAHKAVELLKTGANRTEGERYIPLELWTKESWQNWLKAQYAVGNKLQWGDIKWTFKVGPQKFLFMWVVHVHVWIAAEDRVKSNEVIIGRPDISTIVLLNGDVKSKDPASINMVLVKEFRSSARNSECYIYENAGGSSFKENQDIFTIAAHEVEEETGLVVDPKRIIQVGSRQIASTLTTHKCHLFACLITDEEFKKLNDDKSVHGVIEDTERTYVETCTLWDLLHKDLVDWSQIGMIYQALETIAIHSA